MEGFSVVRGRFPEIEDFFLVRLQRNHYFFSMKTSFIRFLAVLLASGPAGMTATIEWGIEFSDATYSDGSPVLDDFVFQIGTFSPAFTPTNENLSDWESHFLVSGIENHSASWINLENDLFPTFGERIQSSVFRAGGDVQEGDSVFLWGYNSLNIAGSSEWILLTNSNWQFPAPTPSGTEPGSLVRFNGIDSGTEMIFGNSFNLAGNADLFDRVWQTQAVPEPATYAIFVGLGVAGLALRRRLKS